MNNCHHWCWLKMCAIRRFPPHVHRVPIRGICPDRCEKLWKGICPDRCEKLWKRIMFFVIVAVQRKYESIRRQWKIEDRDDFQELNHQISMMRKYRARQKRKFENRAIVVKRSEMKYWEKLRIDDMSEESDDPDDPNTLIVHKLQWRSQELMQFLTTLDSRYQDKTKKEGVLMAKKNRVDGSPSSRPPCPDAPQWAIDPEWKQGSQSVNGHADHELLGVMFFWTDLELYLASLYLMSFREISFHENNSHDINSH